MPIQTECSGCQKQYTADNRMAGKRVRCKNCGTVFEIPAGETADVVVDLDEAPIRATGTSFTAATGAKRVAEDASPFDDVEGDPFASASVTSAFARPNHSFGFPWAVVLDTWLPWLLIGIGLLWTTAESFRENDSGAGWVPPVRQFILMLLYAGIIVPVSMAGAKWAARKMNYELPPTPKLRIAGIFIPAVTLGYVLWLVSGGIGGLIGGLLIGLMLSLGAYWLLFRLEIPELATSMPAAAGAFLGGLAIVIVVLFVLNALFLVIMRTTHTANTLTNSPFGAQFSWEPPAPATNPPGNSMYARAQDPVPGTLNPTSRPTVLQPSELTRPPVTVPSETHELDPPNLLPPATTNQVAVSPPVQPNPPQPTDTLPPLFDPRTILKPPAGTDTHDSIVAAIKGRDLRFVQDVTAPPELSGFDEVIYPATPSNYLATVKHAGEQDHIELWNTQTWKREATADMSREMRGVNRMGGGAPTARGYILSPEGDLLVRIATFPRLSAQIWSFKSRRVLRLVELAEELGTPEVVGFVTPERFAIHWTKAGLLGLELYDGKTGMLMRRINLPAYQHTLANGELSPDGKFFSLVTRVKNKPSLLLYDLTKQTQARSLPLAGLDDRWAVSPGGIAFTADMATVAVFFQHQSEGFVTSWRLKDGKVLGETVCPIGQSRSSEPMIPGGSPSPSGPLSESGRVFDWINEHTWLVHGTVVVDATNGSLLGSLGDNRVIGQHVIDPTSCHLIYNSAPVNSGPTPYPGSGPNQSFSVLHKLVSITLDPAKMVAASEPSQ